MTVPVNVPGGVPIHGVWVKGTLSEDVLSAGESFGSDGRAGIFKNPDRSVLICAAKDSHTNNDVLSSGKGEVEKFNGGVQCRQRLGRNRIG